MSLHDLKQNKTPFPECCDGKVKIVEFSKRHLTKRYVGWLNDKEVVRYSEQRHFKHSISSCYQYYETLKKSDSYFLAVEIIDLNMWHVGNMGVEVDRYNSKADVSIMIGEKSVWGTGVASRAWSLVLNALIKDLCFRLVTAGTMETNVPMINLMKRSGMTIDAILPNRFVNENRQIGLVAASYNSVNYKNLVGSINY